MSWTNQNSSSSAGGGGAHKYSQGAVLTPSSSSITPTDPLHHVAAGTVSTIATTNMDTSVPNELVLIADGTITFATGGNVSIRTSTLGTNGVIRFVLDGSTWREANSTSAALSVKDFGALGDGRTLNITTTNGSAVIVAASGAFSSADVGRSIAIPGAGGSGTALAGTVLTYTDTTHVTLSATASASVVAIASRIATDDSTAIQAALDASLFVAFPPGTYGFTRLRLRTGHQLVGMGGVSAVELNRIGIGSGGAAIAMTSGQAAQGVVIENFVIRGQQVGTNLNGIELGTETPGTTDFALGGALRDVQAWDHTGWQIRLRCNVATLINVWAESQRANPQSTVGGIYVNGNTVNGSQVNIEGNFPLGGLKADAGGGTVWTALQLEPIGNIGATTDFVSVGTTGQLFNGVYILGSVTCRDLIRFESGVQLVRALNILSAETSPMTVTNLIHDVSSNRLVAYAANATCEEFRNYGIQGEWTTFTPTLTASGGNTWTVGSGVARYMITGKTMVVALNWVASTVGAGTPQLLKVAIPGGFTAAANTGTAQMFSDNGTTGTGLAVVSGASATTIDLYKNALGTGTWAVSATNTAVNFTFTFSIQ